MRGSRLLTSVNLRKASPGEGAARVLLVRNVNWLIFLKSRVLWCPPDLETRTPHRAEKNQ